MLKYAFSSNLNFVSSSRDGEATSRRQCV